MLYYTIALFKLLLLKYVRKLNTVGKCLYLNFFLESIIGRNQSKNKITKTMKRIVINR